MINPISWLRELLYGSEKLELTFDVPIEDAIGRLCSKVKKPKAERLTRIEVHVAWRRSTSRIQ